MLKDWLDSKGLSYSEKLVDQNDAARDQMTKISGGFLGVPFSEIVTDGGEKYLVVGFDKGRLESIFK